MALKQEQLKEALEKALEDKGKKKFTQSVELALNFKGINFSKPENRINLDVVLPKGRGKEMNVVVFADGQLAFDAKKAGATVFGKDKIPELAKDKLELKKLSGNSVFLAHPSLMMEVGKHLGQVLGTRDKLPKPVQEGKLENMMGMVKKSVKLRNKGKNLPTVHCLVGSENMSVDELKENINAVMETVNGKVSEHNIESVFVKLTMGKPARVM